MGKEYDAIDDRWRDFIERQPMFFVATAPSGDGGNVNVSPKGYRDTFAVLGERRFAYLDLDGSGVETIAHVRDNARITVMFCSFGRESKILRLFGKGRVVTTVDPEWDDLLTHFGSRTGVRSIIVVDVELIRDACGYGVPRMTLDGERDVLDRYAETETAKTKRSKRACEERLSIDGIPATRSGEYDPTVKV